MLRPASACCSTPLKDSNTSALFMSERKTAEKVRSQLSDQIQRSKINRNDKCVYFYFIFIPGVNRASAESDGSFCNSPAALGGILFDIADCRLQNYMLLHHLEAISMCFPLSLL